jgi:hypothetical protein
MLLYNKALDPNHTILRIISLALKLSIEELEIEKDKIRIFDFLIANPAYISKLSVEKKLVKTKNKFKIYENNYQNFDPVRLFETMSPIYDIALAVLKEMQIITLHSKSKRCVLHIGNIPTQIAKIASNKENSISIHALDFISDHLQEKSLTGPSGLKSISKLMEYRYDVI